MIRKLYADERFPDAWFPSFERIPADKMSNIVGVCHNNRGNSFADSCYLFENGVVEIVPQATNSGQTYYKAELNALNKDKMNELEKELEN